MQRSLVGSEMCIRDRLSLAIFFVFITNSFKKNKSKDISDFVVQVEKGILSDSINTSGEVKAIRTSNIGPRKQGVIKEIKVDEGDLVKKDQVLASLDDEDFIYKIEELELNVEKQKSEFLRREYLYQEGACLLYTSPSPRDYAASRMPSSA